MLEIQAWLTVSTAQMFYTLSHLTHAKISLSKWSHERYSVNQKSARLYLWALILVIEILKSCCMVNIKWVTSIVILLSFKKMYKFLSLLETIYFLKKPTVLFLLNALLFYWVMIISFKIMPLKSKWNIWFFLRKTLHDIDTVNSSENNNSSVNNFRNGVELLSKISI